MKKYIFEMAIKYRGLDKRMENEKITFDYEGNIMSIRKN